MKYIRVLLKDGTKTRFTRTLTKDDVVGIVLGKGRIISLNIYNSIMFPNKGFLRDVMFLNDIKEAEKDMGGIKNTSVLHQYKFLKNIKLKKNEYIPALGELKMFIRRQNTINYVRDQIGLSLIPIDFSLFWSSTLKNDLSPYGMTVAGKTYWGRCGVTKGYIAPFIKTKD